MNPLMVFYILTFFIIDILINEKKLTTIYLVLIAGYWIFYFLVGKSGFHNSMRKWSLATYSQSYDPSVYAKLKYDLSQAKAFMEEHSAKIGKKITYTLFFAKILGEALHLHPETNLAIRFGKANERGTVDIAVLVDLGGKVGTFNSRTYLLLLLEMFIRKPFLSFMKRCTLNPIV